MHIAAVLDPLSEPAQRLSPILLLIRDTLKLPLSLLLAPRLEITSFDELPIQSYYRFVADPLAPRAIFNDLPHQHVLTLRLDVPDSFEVSKLKAAEDTDAMRCSDDINKCENEVVHVEYELKNLIVQGRCAEIGKSEVSDLERE